MSAPSDAPTAAAWHYDGRTALRRAATVVADGDAFVLVEAERQTGPFAFADLRALDESAGYGLSGATGWRLQFRDAPPAAIAARLPAGVRYGGFIDRIGLWPSAAVLAVAAALVVVMALRTPPLVARMVPAGVERQLGDAMFGDFGRNGCVDPRGRAALAALVQRVDPARDLEVDVVNVPVVNAVTLPGGRIVLFNGLLRDARSPDEVAGVIGHEVGHVRHHDVMEALLRQVGLSVLLGGAEQHVGGYTNALLATAYSRDAEQRADGYAITLLDEAKVSPLPTAAFFGRLGGKAGGADRWLAYLGTHPATAGRAARFRAAARPAAGYTPALDPGRWAALKTICKGARDDVDWRF